jgi:hypothetical protein
MTSDIRSVDEVPSVMSANRVSSGWLVEVPALVNPLEPKVARVPGRGTPAGKGSGKGPQLTT